MDPITLASTAWTVGSNAVTLLKGAAEQARTLGKTEIISTLIDVQVAMMEILGEQQKLLDENRALRDRVSSLEEVIDAKKQLEFHHNAYWSRNEDGFLDGPFATQDWDKSKQLVRLTDYDNGEYGGIQKVNFYDITHKHNIFVPLSFLLEEGVNGYTPQSDPKPTPRGEKKRLRTESSY